MALISGGKLGLRGRLILLLLAAFAILISLLAAGFVSQREERIRAAWEDLLDHTRLIAARQQSIAAQAGAILNGLMLSPELRPGASTKACAQLLSERIKQEPKFIQAGRTLPDGELLCAAAPAVSRVRIADSRWFQTALQSREMVVSEVITGQIVVKPTVVFAKAMRDQAGRVTGILYLALDLGWLDRELAATDLPEGARLVVVDGNGVVAVRHPDPEGWVGKTAEHLPLLQRIRAAGGEGTADDIGLDGVQRLFAYAPLLKTVSGPMYLWLAVPKAVIEAPGRHEALIGLGVMLAVLIGTLGLVIWGGNLLVLRPLLILSRVAARIGAGDLGARTGLPHSEDDFGRLARALDETADAIEDRERKLARANRALRVLSAGNRALLRARGEQELLEEMCQAIVEAGGYRIAWLGYAEHDREKSVRPVASWGAESDFLNGIKITWSETESGRGPTGTAIRRGIPVTSNDIAGDPDYTPWRERAQRFGYASSLALPLRIDGAVIGALNIYAAEPDAFDDDVVELLTEAADDLAFGIVTLRTRAERDRSAYEHEHHAEILQKSLEQSIRAIADTVDARDPYTAGHQRRVGELAVAIAREMGLPEEKIRGIHLAAAVHDLGKIHIPAEILTKPGKLSDIEFMLIKTHPQAGYEILKDVDFPWPIADIVRQHHEKLDGSGYPQGLKDGQILLESRIMTVADVVETMSSHRPYRPSLGIELALKEIERGRGSAYDPAVTDACLKLFREGRFAFQT
jgi:putative nucleotidyltransferase with HDIG domain